MQRILVADAIHESGVDFLKGFDGVETDVRTDLDEAALLEVIGDYDALIVRSKTKARANVLEAGTRLKAIGRAGIGTDNIDIAEATRRGIVVFNTPDANATTTAELAVAHILSASRHLPLADANVRSGGWERSRFMGTEVTGKSVGIIGFGTIGRIVAQRCAGLKMNVLAFDPFVLPEVVSEYGATLVSLDELLAGSDYVTLHCALVDATRGMIGAAELGKMKPGARLINCARGGLVVESDLVAALRDKTIAGAALDVFENEPPENSALLELDNVVLTPHLGASTEEAQRSVGAKIAECIGNFLLHGQADTAVNLPRISDEQLGQAEPYRRLSYALGRLIGALCEGPVSEFVVRRYGKVAELDGRPITTDALIGLLEQRVAERVNRVNASHLAQDHGIGVRESKSEKPVDFVSLIEVCATIGGKTTTVAGTLLGGAHPRLVRIDSYHLEAVPEGHILFTRHEDKPGVVGALGGILGDANINISRMQVGICDTAPLAIALVGVSGPLPQTAMHKISQIPAIEQVVQIEL